MFDVVIVGGGPAGSAAALALRASRPEARVAVLEGRSHPRDKACGGALSPRGIRALQDLGVPVSVPHRRVRGAVLTGAGGKRFRLDKPMGVVVRRPELDAVLAQAAVGRGATLLDRCRVRGLTEIEGGVRLATSQGPIEARWVIGADGAAGFAAPWVEPFARPPIRAVDVITRPRVHDDEDLLHFDFSLTRAGLRGYAWDFPCREGGADACNRGVYAAAASTVRPRALSVERDGDAPRNGAIVRAFEKSRRLARGRVLLAGDSVGANALTGEGLAPAIEGGARAGRYAAALLRLRAGDAAGYSAHVRATPLGRRLWWWCGIAKRLYGEHGDWWTEVAMSDGAFHDLMADDYIGAVDAPDVGGRFVRYLVQDVARYWVRGGALRR